MNAISTDCIHVIAWPPPPRNQWEVADPNVRSLPCLKCKKEINLYKDPSHCAVCGRVAILTTNCLEHEETIQTPNSKKNKSTKSDDD